MRTIGSFFALVLCLNCGCHRAENIRFLSTMTGAEWIRYPNPPDILAHTVQTNDAELPAVFRRDFVLREVPAAAPLEIHSLETWEVVINGQPIAEGKRAPRRAVELDIAPALHVGTNEITVTVTNRSGPPLLWLRLKAGPVELASGTSWECSFAGANWRQAQLAEAPRSFRAGNPMRNERTVFESLRRQTFTVTILFLLAFVLALLARRWSRELKLKLTEREQITLMLSGLVIMWIVIFVHNVSQIGPSHGFDTVHHVAYIKFIQENHALPKGGAGWETHQPPLYYLIAAAVLQLFQWDAATLEGLRALRYLSMLFGMGQILLVFASLRLLFRNELERPFLGTAMAAFLPAHIYHSHYVTNETFVALLVSGTFYLFLRVLRHGKFNPWLSLALGVCLGAALLAKLTALIVAAVLALAFATQLFLQRNERRRWFATAGIVFVACAIVCGWYYLALWKTGGPWNSARWAYGSGWWQEDGYRTAKYYLRFGESLVRPLYSGFHSFWDGIYSTLWGDGLCGGMTSVDFRPPWEYDLVAVGYWISLVPTLAVLAGFCVGARTLIQRRAVEWLALLGTTSLFALALGWFSLVAPGTSQVRASFGLILMVPFCAMFAAGLGTLIRMHSVRTAVIALAIFWALNSYFAHWVPRSSAQPQLARAKWLFENGLFEPAARVAEEGLRREPSKSTLRSMLADCWNQLGKTNEARELVEQALARWPNDPNAHLDIGFEQARAGYFDAAIVETRRALQLAPDNGSAARQLVALLMRAQRPVEAEMACREALRIEPYSAELHRWLAELESLRVTNRSQ